MDLAIPGELECLLEGGTARSMLDAIMTCIPSASLLVRAPDAKILRISDFAGELFGRPREAWEGRLYPELVAEIAPRDAEGRPFEIERTPLMRALRGERVAGYEGGAWTAAGAYGVFQGSAAPIRNAAGEVIGAISALSDLTVHKALEAELRASAERKEALYLELTHRVKNHLNLVAAMVVLETRDPEVTAKALGERIVARMQTLAAVYDSMTEAETAGSVEAKSFLENVVRPYAEGRVEVAVCCQEALTLPPDQAGPIGMLVNEAVANAVKHAFPGGGGRVDVELRRETPGRLTLEIADDGRGVDAASGRAGSHGLGLMRLQARQLKSELEIAARPGGGTRVAVDIPEGGSARAPAS